MSRVAVVGAGTMGNGIAHVFAQHGWDTTLIDVAPGLLERVLAVIRTNLERQVKKGSVTAEQRDAALARIRTSMSLDSVVDAQLVVEAANEQPDVKFKIFRDIDRLAPPAAILASNTSSISITAIAAQTKRPAQVIGMHFMNPVPVMPLVEVVRGLETADKTVAEVVEVAKALGKTPVEVNDAPGFVSNRVLMPMINEAIFCVMEGVATPEAIDELGRLGFLGMCAPEEYDGMGLDSVTYLLALEEIAAADASVAVSLSIHNAIPTTMLVRHGSPAQKDRWLKAMARGELLAGFSMSEPESGSDAASLTTRAVRDGSSWVLSGAKAWATNGGTADLMMVMARSERGIGAFIVPTDASGYRPGKPEDKMGLRASNTVALTLEDVRLPADHLLGDEGEGFGYAMEGLDAGRLGIAVQAVGIARRALEHSLAYCAERRQFGRSLREFQAVQFKLADMATRIEAARALAHAAATRRDRGEDTTVQASMAKLFASETAMCVTTQAVQLFGGYGYMRDFPVEKLFRDAKVTEIYEGTSEIQRIIVARGLYPRA